MVRTDEQILNDIYFLNPPLVKEIYFLEPVPNYQDREKYPRNIKFYQSPYDRYLISKCGKVFDLKTNRLVSIAFTNNGYMRVFLNIDDGDKWFYVHRLIAQTFINNDNNYDIVHHLDDNHLHNHVNNLAWVTTEENNVSHRRKSHNKVYDKNDVFIEKQRKSQDNIQRINWNTKKTDTQTAKYIVDHSNDTFHVEAATKIRMDIYDENDKLLYNNLSLEDCINVLKMPVRYLDYIRSNYMTLEYMFFTKDDNKRIHAFWNGREVYTFLGMKEATQFFSRQANQLYKKINTPREVELLSKKYHIVIRQDTHQERFRQNMQTYFNTLTDKGKRVIFDLLTLKNILTNS